MKPSLKRLPIVLAALATCAVSLTACAAPAPPPPTAPLTDTELQALADAVARYVDEGAIIGAELLVKENGEIVLHEAFGWRDREDEVPMQPGTIFNLRSMTKPLVATAVEILIEEGALARDSRAAEFLPAFDNERARAITIDQLLTHRAGLPLYIMTNFDEYPDLQSLAEAAGERGPQFTPGERFYYSDVGADVLGAIVERVSGQPLDAFIDERILVPLGMSDTAARIAAGDPRLQRVASLYARQGSKWLRFWQPQEATLYPFMLGSQGLYGTLEDYTRFLDLWLAAGEPGAPTVLSPDSVSYALTPVSAMTALGSDLPAPTGFVDMDVCYGRMAEIRTRSRRMSAPCPAAAAEDPVRIIGHSGSDGTLAWAWPERDLQILYFTQSRGNLTHLRLERVIDEEVLHTSEPAPRPDPEVLEPLLGTYLADFRQFDSTELRVFVQDGFLAIDVPGMMVTELEAPPDARDGGAWTSTILPDLSMSFVRDDAGNVVALRWHEGTATFEAPRGAAPAEPTLTAEAVAPYLGRYHDPANGTVVEMVFHNGTLAARLPGTPEPVEFRPPDEEGYWVLRLNPGLRIRFNEDEDGRVVSYTVYAPDGSSSVRPRVAGQEAR